MGVLLANGRGIAVFAVFDGAGNAADGGHADTGALVDLPVRDALKQQRHHPPAVGHGLKLGGRTEVAQEGGDLFRLVQHGQRFSQRPERDVGFLLLALGRTLLHRANVIARYYIVKQKKCLWATGVPFIRQVRIRPAPENEMDFRPNVLPLALLLCLFLAAPHSAATPGDGCRLPPKGGPISSRAALDAWLQRCPSPLRHMTPGARGRFLDSLDFNERGVIRLLSDDLSSELTREEIGQVFALFGMPASTAPAGISHEEAEWLRDDTRQASSGRGESDTERRFNTLYHASLSAPDDDSGAAVAALYDELFPAGNFPDDFPGVSAHEVRLMYRAALIASWYGYRAAHVTAAARALAELERHGITTTGELGSMYQVLIHAGQLEEARQFARRHTAAGLEPLPPLHEPVPVADDVPSILRLSPAGDALLHEAADLESVQIVVVAGPGCRYSQAAALAITQDPELGPVFQRKALWLASHTLLDDHRALQHWNNAHPGAPLVIAASPERWPMLDLDTVPQFHVFRDGELAASVSGWPVEEGNRDAVLAALRSAGLLADP